MASSKETALRKRQQIDSSKKTMFMFVAGAAFIAGAALVVGIFLVKQIIFHSKIVAAKQETISSLDNNLNTTEELKKQLKVLETNQDLKSVQLKEDSSALQSVLDALPAEANADALGASLQRKFVNEVNGLQLNGLTIDSVDEATGVDGEAQQATSDGESVVNAIGFTMNVQGSATSIKELMQRFERSIRVITITNADIQALEGGGLAATFRGYAQYEPAQQIELEKKVVKP